jgi:hypothetical protein
MQLVLVCLLACAAPLAAQVSPPPAAASAPALATLSEFAALPATTGGELWLLEQIEELLPPGLLVERDAFGSLLVRAGSAPVTRVVAVGVDEPGYVVSQIRDDGYLRLRFLGRVATPAFHLAQEGRPARVLLRGDGVPGAPLAERPGVLLVTSIHLKHPRPPQLEEADLYLDVGADSPADVEALGIRLLDPVVVREAIAFHGDRVAAPDLGQRACALALLTALREVPAAQWREGLACAFVAQSLPGSGPLGRGGEGVLRRLAPAEVLLLRGRDGADGAVTGPDDLAASGADWSALELRTAHAGTPVETVVLADLQELAARLRTEVSR